MDTKRLRIDRPVYTQSTLDAAFKLREIQAPSVGRRIKESLKKKLSCTPRGCAKTLWAFFPFLDHLNNYRYKWKENLPGDITAGITVGIVHIPMSFGFALLANVPPVYGLYTSFWCVLLYFLFGQSQHLSFGTMAITSIMVAQATNIQPEEMVTYGNQTHTQMKAGILNPQIDNLTSYANHTVESFSGDVSSEITKSAVLEKTFLISMMTGLILIVMSVFRLSKVVVFIPQPCISGFTTAAAFHIMTSQVKFILGINIPGHIGIFKLVKIWKEIILQVPNTNFCDLIISICCFIFLVAVKEIVNPKFKHKLPVPIPAEILVVLVVTLISFLAELSTNYGILIVEEVPAGFVAPNIPDFHGFQSHIVDAFLLAIISFVASYSMVSTFSRKHKYDFDPGQEMIAYGICHLIGSMMGSIPAAAAPPRCTVLDTTGAKTQVVHMFTSIILLLTILLIGPLFEPLPNSCLSAIIVSALIPLFMQFQHLIPLWKINKYDFAIWLVTWASVVFLDINIGLAIGVGFSITTIALQSCLASGQTLSVTGHVDLLQPTDLYELSEQVPGIKIFRFNSNLQFVTQAKFKDELFASTLNPTKLLSTMTKKPTKSDQLQMNTDEENNLYKEQQKDSYSAQHLLSDIHTIIIDFSSIHYIDTMGVNLIKQLMTDFGHVGISLVLANCCGATTRALGAGGLRSRKRLGDSGEKSEPDDKTGILMFPTIQDAITVCAEKRTIRAS